MGNIFGVKPEPGKIVYGSYELQTHPGGLLESVPLAIVQGTEEGPTISISANLHGDEYTGTIVLHELLKTENLVNNLKGTIICLFSLNPIAAALNKREYSLTADDPNRTFPDEESLNRKEKSFTEISTEKIFQELRRHTNLHIDLHCSKIYSHPFIYLDPSFPETKETVKMSEIAANDFGLYTLIDNRDSYFKKKYHKTFTGSLINLAKIPAFTVELGSKKVVDKLMVEAGITGIKNVLKGKGMLPGEKQEIQNLTLKPMEEKYEINLHPLMSQSGVIFFLVKPGDFVNEGDPVAKIRTIHGLNIGDGFIRSKLTGHVICQFEGAFFNSGKPLLKIATKISE